MVQMFLEPTVTLVENLIDKIFFIHFTEGDPAPLTVDRSITFSPPYSQVGIHCPPGVSGEPIFVCYPKHRSAKII